MADLIGQSLGRYHILEQLGQGGMATVYKAYDTRLERDVAVKIIRQGAFPPDQLDRILKRFEREAKALAKLSHPNIVGVIDYGEHEGSPYLVMEFLPGGTLKQRLGKPMPWDEAVRLLIPIARALQFAHVQGIIHRDIKPSNILITKSDEPMLTDFGIAKLLETEETATLTGTGIGVGTPEYMSPEQWTGSATAQSDMYSLGVLLYELVAGRKPYQADTPAAILLKQANDPLPRPKGFVHDLPDAVEKVLVKTLAKKPEDRYQGMGGLISALNGLLEGKGRQVANVTQPREKKVAKPVEKRERIPTSRNAYLAPLILAAGVVLLGVLYLAGRSILQSPAVLEPTLTPAASPVIRVDLPVITTPSPTVTGTVTSMPTPTDTPTREPRFITWDATTIPWGETPITSENANRLEPLAMRRITMGYRSRPVPNSLVLSADGSSFFYDWGSFIYQMQIPDGSTTAVTGNLVKQPDCLAFSSAGGILAIGQVSQISLMSIEDGTVLQTFKRGITQTYYYCYEAFSPDGTLLAFSDGNKINIFRTADGSLYREIQLDGVTRFNGLSFSPGGSLLASGSGENEVYVWNISTGSLVKSLPGGEYDFGTLGFSPDGKMLAAAAFDGTTWIWETSGWSVLHQFPGSGTSSGGQDYSRLAYSVNSEVLAVKSGSTQNTDIDIWDLSGGNLLKKIELIHQVWGLNFLPDGTMLLVSMIEPETQYFSLWGIEP